MPEGKAGLEAGVEKKDLAIDGSKLLSEIYGGGESVESEYEVESRYLPARLLSPEELGQYRSLHIEQAYVRALDEQGKKHTFRLRRTFREGEGILLRVAHKKKMEGKSGRDELQIRFPENDPRAGEFGNLWKRHEWNTVRKTRYYVPHKLPNGSPCEIHYDVHKYGEMHGVVRIEVEFRSDADQEYARTYGERAFPDWIGEEVTSQEGYGGKSIARDGFPAEAIRRTRELSSGAR